MLLPPPPLKLLVSWSQFLLGIMGMDGIDPLSVFGRGLGVDASLSILLVTGSDFRAAVDPAEALLPVSGPQSRHGRLSLVIAIGRIMSLSS